MARSLIFDYSSNCITYVQLLPVYDFGSVRWRGSMVPQATGAMILFNTMFQKAAMRVILTILMHELVFQDTIDTYHQANLSVIMDVVYNHVYQADEYAWTDHLVISTKL